MKAAIALFGKRISPRFDCTQDFMVVCFCGHKVTSKLKQTIPEKISVDKARYLADLEVTTVICGGVDLESVHSLKKYGISIIPDVTGEAEMILDLFVDGKLTH